MGARLVIGSVFLLLPFALLVSNVRAATPKLPWSFGMTKQEVQAVTEYGPYRSFSNGDLETYNGMLDGRKQDFQFFFNNGRLARIGVDLYEGTDLAAAATEWLDLYTWMSAQFGKTDTPGSDPPTGDGIVFKGVAQTIVRAGGKPQMAPMEQSADMFVFASLGHYEVQGETYYIVFLFFDPPHA